MATDGGSVAVLGTGTMGGGIARRMLAAGREVRVWNRTGARARPLGAAGAVVVDSPSEATAGAASVITMLSDAAAVRDVLRYHPAPLAGLGDRALWVQMGTVGVTATAEFMTEAQRHGVTFVDAPVLGTKATVEAGELTVLGSGPEFARPGCAALVAPFASRVLWVGGVGAGSRLKLAVNHWIYGMVTALADTVSFSEVVGLDPARFLEAIAGTRVDAAHVQAKGVAMARRDYTPSSPLRLAPKDLLLILEAAEVAGTDSPGIRRALELATAAIAKGYGDQDFAAIREVSG